MKSVQLLMLSILLTGSITIQTMAQDPSAIVDFESTDKGVLLPRMTFLEREAIAEDLTVAEAVGVDPIRPGTTDL